MKKIRNQKGVTLVALVVTIIVLIILAGVSINLTLGDNGIITIAKKAKENTELAKIQEEKELNELYTQLTSENFNSENLPYDSIAKLTEFKTAIANAIGEAGGVKPNISAETSVFANNIKGIVKEVTKNATATAEDIAEGKTAWVNGELIVGTRTALEISTIDVSSSILVSNKSTTASSTSVTATYEATESKECVICIAGHLFNLETTGEVLSNTEAITAGGAHKMGLAVLILKEGETVSVSGWNNARIYKLEPTIDISSSILVSDKSTTSSSTSVTATYEATESKECVICIAGHLFNLETTGEVLSNTEAITAGGAHKMGLAVLILKEGETVSVSGWNNAKIYKIK